MHSYLILKDYFRLHPGLQEAAQDANMHFDIFLHLSSQIAIGDQPDTEDWEKRQKEAPGTAAARGPILQSRGSLGSGRDHKMK